MSSLESIYEQLVAFDEHDGPTDAGDTLMGSIAHSVVDQGWARVSSDGKYHVTIAGQIVADELRRGIRG